VESVVLDVLYVGRWNKEELFFVAAKCLEGGALLDYFGWLGASAFTSAAGSRAVANFLKIRRGERGLVT
jgi:hypothetical protein